MDEMEKQPDDAHEPIPRPDSILSSTMDDGEFESHSEDDDQTTYTPRSSHFGDSHPDLPPSYDESQAQHHDTAPGPLALPDRNASDVQVYRTEVPPDTVPPPEKEPLEQPRSFSPLTGPSVLLSQALMFTHTTPVVDGRFAHQLTRPVALPSIPGKVNPIKFARFYPKILHAYSITPELLMDFVDGLNALSTACAASPATLRAIDPGFQVSDETQVHPDNLIAAYLSQANRTFFAPRGLQVQFLTLPELADRAKVPQDRVARAGLFSDILRAHRVGRDIPAAANGAATAAVQVLEPYVEPLSFGVPEPQTHTEALNNVASRFAAMDLDNAAGLERTRSQYDAYAQQREAGQARRGSQGSRGSSATAGSSSKPFWSQVGNVFTMFGQNQNDFWNRWGEDQGKKWERWGEEQGKTWGQWGDDLGRKFSGSGGNSCSAAGPSGSVTGNPHQMPAYPPFIPRGLPVPPPPPPPPAPIPNSPHSPPHIPPPPPVPGAYPGYTNSQRPQFPFPGAMFGHQGTPWSCMPVHPMAYIECPFADSPLGPPGFAGNHHHQHWHGQRGARGMNHGHPFVGRGFGGGRGAHFNPSMLRGPHPPPEGSGQVYPTREHDDDDDASSDSSETSESSEDDKHPDLIFAEKSREIERMATEARTKGKKTPKDIEYERAKMLKKATDEQRKGLSEWDLKGERRQWKRDKKAWNRKVKHEKRARKREFKKQRKTWKRELDKQKHHGYADPEAHGNRAAEVRAAKAEWAASRQALWDERKQQWADQRRRWEKSRRDWDSRARGDAPAESSRSAQLAGQTAGVIRGSRDMSMPGQYPNGGQETGYAPQQEDGQDELMWIVVWNMDY